MKTAFAASFVVSCVALALQFTLTRILSVVYWQHLVYGILTVSLLGFAASGAALARIPRLERMDPESFVRLCLGGFALSSLLAVGAAGALSGDFFTLTVESFGPGNVARLFLSYLFAAAPFFFFGLLILGLFRRYPEQSGPLYAGNLLGSATGVLLYLFAIRPLGALGLLRLGIFLPAALAALSGARHPRRWAAGLAAAFVASLFIRLEPDRHKQYWTLMPDREVELTEWNAISRVDVIRSRRGGSRHILIDGDAQAPIVPPPRVVEARARFRWLHPNPMPKSLQTRDHRLGFVFDAPAGGELGFFVLVKARTDRVIFHLQTAGNRHSLAVRTHPGQWNRLYVGYDAARKMSQVVENFSTVEQMGWDWIEIAGRSRLVVEGIDGARGFAQWDYNLDLMETYALDPQTKGFERLISHHLHRLGTGKPPGHVLVIGNGGGADSVYAANAGAERVTAVEINPSSHDLVKYRYADYLGRFFDRENVRLVLEDGRSFVRRSKDAYDVIALVGVDSLAASASGAYVLAESYLYTREALKDYWDHLTADGRLQLSRWHFPEAPRETLRLFTMAFEVLRERGVKDPFAHLAVVSHRSSQKPEGGFATLIVSRRPFSPEVRSGLKAWLDSRNVLMLFDPGAPERDDNAFHRFSRAARAGGAEGFYRDYLYDVSPVTDDRPFFFQYGKWSHLLRPYPANPVVFDSMVGRWPFFILLALLVQCSLGGAVLLWLSRPRTAGGPVGRSLVYFGLLGVAFLFVEMVLIQKGVLLLGHPIYAMGLVIPSLLVAASLGSALSRRWKPGPLFFGCLALGLGAVALGLPALFAYGLHLSLPLRAALLLALILPLGAAMGVPFPSGMAALAPFPRLIPFAWAVNGSLSVLASVAAVVVAMPFGFTTLLMVAAGAYALAGWAFPGRIPAGSPEPCPEPARRPSPA